MSNTQTPQAAEAAQTQTAPAVERKVPLWAKLALLVCILFFVALFMAFASSVSSSGGVG